MNTSARASAHVSREKLLVLGAISLLFVGLVYAWSIFSAAIGADTGWSRADLGVTFRVSMIFFCLGGLLGSQITKVSSPRVTTLVAAALMAAGFVSTALLVRSSVTVLYVTYGLVVGLGCGVAYNAIISTVNLYFSDKIGLSSGILLLGYGLGSLLLGTPLHFLMDTFGWRTIMVAVGIAIFVLIGAYGMLLGAEVDLPEDVRMQLGARAGAGAGGASAAGGTSATGLSSKEMLSQPLIYVYLVWVILVSTLGIAFIGDAMQGALSLGISAGVASFLVGLLSVANGASRLVAGSLNDRIGFWATLIYISVSAVIGSLLALLAFQQGSAPLFVASLIFVGMSYGGVPVASACFVRAEYGPAHYSQNLAVVNLNIIPTSLLSGVVVAQTLAHGDAATYQVFLGIMGAALLIGLVFLRVRKKKRLGG